MNTKEYQSIDDFSPEQVQKFDAMHKSLRDYNASLRKGASPLEPAFTDDDMRVYGQYRQLLLSRQLEE